MDPLKFFHLPFLPGPPAEDTGDDHVTLKHTLEIVGVSEELLASATPGEDFIGPTFGANGVEWRLVVNLGGDGDDPTSAGHISAFISLVAAPGGAKVVTKTHSLTAGGITRRSGAPSAFEAGDSLGWSRFATHSDVAKGLDGGVLSVSCSVTFAASPSAEWGAQRHALRPVPPPTLAGELRRLWEQRREPACWGADVALLCSSGRRDGDASGPLRLSAHSFFLSLRSPFFAALLERQRRCQDGHAPATPSGRSPEPSPAAPPLPPSFLSVRVPEDVSADTVEHALHFIYTDELPELASVDEARPSLRIFPLRATAAVLRSLRLLAEAGRPLGTRPPARPPATPGAAPPRRGGPLRPPAPRGAVRALPLPAALGGDRGGRARAGRPNPRAAAALPLPPLPRAAAGGRRRGA